MRYRPITEVDVSETCAAHLMPPPPGRESACREWDPYSKTPGWAVAGPLCETELRVAARDVPMLLFDFLDLEQMLPRPLSQALDGQPSGKPGPPTPLALAPEALQAEIVHVLTTWEVEIRAGCNLSDPPTFGPNLPWHTTVSKRPPLARVRPGAAVQRAVGVLAPRLDVLARMPATAVQATGTEDPCEDVYGWEAVLHLCRLHARARSMLGRTRRTAQLPGDCSGCGAFDLRRDEPRDEGDPCPVYCGRCARQWSDDEYQRYVSLMVAPGLAAA
jgi:hypothetical protein